MTTPSLRADSPPKQADLVPDNMNRFHQWRSDGTSFELWVHQQNGVVLADPSGRFEPAGTVMITGDQMSVIWRGTITDRPQTWLNAQRARAARAYFGGPHE